MSQTGWRKWHRWVGFAAVPFLALCRSHGNHRRGHRVPERGRGSARKGPRADQHGEGAGPDNRLDRANRPCADECSGTGRWWRQSTRSPWTSRLTHPPSPSISANRRAARTRSWSSIRAPARSLREERYEDKPFLTRLHSGEAFGDWGLVLGIGWGTALVVLIVTGLVIYLAMRKPGRTGLRRVFW